MTGVVLAESDRPQLLKQFNDALKKLKADGTYDKLVAKYL